MYNPILLYGTKFYRDLLDPGKTNKQGVKNSAAQFPFSQNLIRFARRINRTCKY